MNCEKCGALLDEGAKFCKKCGNQLSHRPARHCAVCGTELGEDCNACPVCESIVDPNKQKPAEAFFENDRPLSEGSYYPDAMAHIQSGKRYPKREAAFGEKMPDEGTIFAGRTPELTHSPAKKSKAPVIAAAVAAGAVLLGGGIFLGANVITKDSGSSDDDSSKSERGGTTTVTTTAETAAATDAPVEESSDETQTTTTTTTTTTTAEPKPQYDGPVYDKNAKQSVLVIEEPDTGAWANCLGSDYIDYHTLPRDRDLHFTMEVKLSDSFVGMMEAGILNGDEQIGIAPTSQTPYGGWVHLGEVDGRVDGEFPISNKLKTMDGYTDGTYKLVPQTDKDGNVKTDKEGNPKFNEDVYMADDETKLAPLYMKPDGFIKWSDEAWRSWGSETQTLEFTLTKECVNEILDTIAADVAKNELDENGNNMNDWGGILFQCSGNFEVNKITIDCGNILLNSQYYEWQESHPDEVWGK